MSMKFGLLIHVDLRKRVTSSNTKPQVVRSRRGCHLEMYMTSLLSRGIWTKFRKLIQNNTQITVRCLKSQSEEKFQYGGRLFFQTGSSYILAIN